MTDTAEIKNDELRDNLMKAIDSALDEKTLENYQKKTKALADALLDDLDYGIKENMACSLSHFVIDAAENAVKAILDGNEDTMRSYLSCGRGYTGRDRDHSVIHGRLFETGPLALRKKIVDQHAELLKNERILDLEDQIKSLVDQVNKANAEKDAMYERCRIYL